MTVLNFIEKYWLDISSTLGALLLFLGIKKRLRDFLRYFVNEYLDYWLGVPYRSHFRDKILKQFLHIQYNNLTLIAGQYFERDVSSMEDNNNHRLTLDHLQPLFRHEENDDYHRGHVIYGSPGRGKSTLLKMLFKRYAESFSEGKKGYKKQIPLYLNLRKLNEISGDELGQWSMYSLVDLALIEMCKSVDDSFDKGSKPSEKLKNTPSSSRERFF